MAKSNTITENLSEKERSQKMTKEQTMKIEKLDDLISNLSCVKCNLMMIASGIEESGSDTGRYAVEAAAGMIERIDSEMQDIVNDLLAESEELDR